MEQNECRRGISRLLSRIKYNISGICYTCPIAYDNLAYVLQYPGFN